MNKNLACVIMLLIGTNLIADNSKDMPRTGTYYDYYKDIFVKAAAGTAQFEGKASNGNNSNFNRDIQTLTLGKYLDDNNRISIRKEYSDSLDNTKVDMNTLTYDVLVPYREGRHEGPRPFAGFSYTFAKFSNTANTVKSETVFFVIKIKEGK